MEVHLYSRHFGSSHFGSSHSVPQAMYSMPGAPDLNLHPYDIIQQQTDIIEQQQAEITKLRAKFDARNQDLPIQANINQDLTIHQIAPGAHIIKCEGVKWICGSIACTHLNYKKASSGWKFLMDDQKTSWGMLLQKDPALSKYRGYQKKQVFITEQGFLSMVLGCRMKTADDIRNTTVAYLMKEAKKNEVELPSSKRPHEDIIEAVIADMGEHLKRLRSR